MFGGTRWTNANFGRNTMTPFLGGWGLLPGTSVFVSGKFFQQICGISIGLDIISTIYHTIL